MTTETIKLENISFKIYTIEYKGETFKVGDNGLRGIINQSLLDNTYYSPMFKTADDSIVSPQYIDEDIYCYLGEDMEFPTQDMIIENIKDILEEI